MGKGKCGYLGYILGWFEPCMEPVGSQMDYLGCQDTEWEGGNDKEGLEAILLWDGFMLAWT